MSGTMMTFGDCLFSRAFKEKTNMWFPSGRQKIEEKSQGESLKRKSDQWGKKKTVRRRIKGTERREK